MQLKIYYLDDESDLCEIFKDNFESDSVVIQTFTDPELAFLATKNSPPHLIFLDFRLPGTTGDQIASRIGPSVPKVLVTGELDIKPESSFVKIFSKPFEFSEMAEFLKDFAAQANAREKK
ncbi:MAG TPA: response regulator [Oligoflexia bacterium]|nr:response regulator [Oligoflexia bacterium]